jgi:hypothetical protein
VARLLAIKERLGLFTRRTVSLERVVHMVGRRAYGDSAMDVTTRAIVLIRDSAGVVDRLRETPRDVGLITYAETLDPDLFAGFRNHLAERGHRVRSWFRLYPASGPASYDSARTASRIAPYAIVAVSVRARSGRGSIAMPPGLATFIDERVGFGPTVLVSFGSPFLLEQVPSIGSLLLAWTVNPFTQAAAAGALSGAAITGRVPVAHPPFYEIGDGLPRPDRVAARGAGTR